MKYLKMVNWDVVAAESVLFILGLIIGFAGGWFACFFWAIIPWGTP